MRHSPNLDILRAIAVFTVLIDHLAPTLHSHAGYDNQQVLDFLGSIGHAGVLAFFVHTTLVLMYSLARMHATFPRVAFRFYVRRIFRIYPLAIFCIVLAVVLHIPSITWKEPPEITTGIIVANLLLMQNLIYKTSVLAPLWSLPYEVQMYVTLPALYLLTRLKKGLIYIAAVLVFTYVLAVALGFLGHLGMAVFLPYFVSGVLCYMLRNRQKKFIPAVLWTPYLIVLVWLFCLVNNYDGDTWYTVTPTFWSAWIFSLVLALSINCFKDSTSPAGNLVANKIATYSYGMYLLHVPVLYLLFMRLQMKNLALAIPLYFVLTAAASVVTFHLIESPMIEVGRRLSSRGKRRTGSDLEPVMPAP